MTLLILIFLSFISIVASPSGLFAQTAERISHSKAKNSVLSRIENLVKRDGPIRPYIAVGGLFGAMDECSSGVGGVGDAALCEQAFGIEAAVGVQTHHVRGEVFYAFNQFKTDSRLLKVDNFTFPGETEAERHMVGTMGLLRIPLFRSASAAEKTQVNFNFIGPFVGVGVGYIWQSYRVSIVEPDGSRPTSIVVTEGDVSSFLVVLSAGLEADITVGHNHSMALEAGYRYHHTTRDHEVEKAHLGVVRLRYGF